MQETKHCDVWDEDGEPRRFELVSNCLQEILELWVIIMSKTYSISLDAQDHWPWYNSRSVPRGFALQRSVVLVCMDLRSTGVPWPSIHKFIVFKASWIP